MKPFSKVALLSRPKQRLVWADCNGFLKSSLTESLCNGSTASSEEAKASVGIQMARGRSIRSDSSTSTSPRVPPSSPKTSRVSSFPLAERAGRSISGNGSDSSNNCTRGVNRPYKAVLAVIRFLFLPLAACLALAGCGSDNVTYTAPNTAALGAAISKAQDSNAKASTIAQKVVTHGTAAGSQDAVQLQSLLKTTQVALREAQDEKAKGDVLNGKLAQHANEEEDAKNAALKAGIEKDKKIASMSKRFTIFLAFALAFEIGCTIAAPYIFKAASIQVPGSWFIPDFIPQIVCAAGAAIIIFSTLGILALFGFL